MRKSDPLLTEGFLRAVLLYLKCMAGVIVLLLVLEYEIANSPQDTNGTETSQ